MRAINFTVYGHPAPQGSSRAFMPKGARFPVVTSTNPKLKPWRQQVAGVALSLNEACFEAHVPLKMIADFYFDRPKSVTTKKRPGMTSAPDVDKLARSCCDALKSILLYDDAQVVNLHARKFYGGPERVEITICEYWVEA